MTTTPLQVEALEIREAHGLDKIHVYWVNLLPGQGHVTITCYGSAWTAYFGGMGGKTTQEFFAGCGVDYLQNKLGIDPLHLKSGKSRMEYLGRIIRAVQAALKQEGKA